MKKAFLLIGFLLIILVPFSLFAYQKNAGEALVTLQSGIEDSTKFATLYIYRPANSVGGLVGYKINVNDSAIVKIKNNTKAAVRIYKEGPVQLSVGTEERKTNLNIQFGQSYYLKFGMISGLVGARPEINLISPEQGQAEYDTIRDKKPKN